MSVSGKEMEKAVTREVEELFESIGCPLEYVAKKHKNILRSTKIEAADKLRAIHMFYNIFGAYKPKENKLEVTNDLDKDMKQIEQRRIERKK